MTRTNPTIRTGHRRTPRRRGFSLIELLVVIGIIALLAALSLTAGIGLLRERKNNVTESLLSTLDRALEEYLTATNGNIPKYDVEDYENVPGPEVFADGSEPNDLTSALAFPDFFNDGQHPRFPDASVFIRQALGTGEVDNLIANMPDGFLVVTRGEEDAGDGDQSLAPSVIDAWANDSWDRPWPVAEQQLIYYVHPDNDLAQALYGRCQNGRPYFMSAGPDGFYGNGWEFDRDARGGGAASEEAYEMALEALEDNLYSYPGVKGTHSTSSDMEDFR